jgi:thymidylate synthase
VEIVGASVDDILMKLYQELPKHLVTNAGSRGKIVAEILGVSLRVDNPRARISRSENRGKPFSALGELLWYLAKSDRLDFIEHYISQYHKDAVDGVLQGAYGPRIFAMRGKIDQMANVVSLLQGRPDSKRAVIQLFDAEDIQTQKKEVPCTTALQFLLRDGKLNLFATMRSNDAYFGVPHDVFCFTMLQEMVARRLGVDLGSYFHYASSMHVYDGFLKRMAAYVDEGYQKDIEMPPMPGDDPFELAQSVLALEERLRRDETIIAADEIRSPYWADIVRLLQILWQPERTEEIRAQLVDPVYKSFVDSRRQLLEQSRPPKA